MNDREDYFGPWVPILGAPAAWDALYHKNVIWGFLNGSVHGIGTGLVMCLIDALLR